MWQPASIRRRGIRGHERRRDRLLRSSVCRGTQPAEGAPQLLGSFLLVRASVGDDHLLRLPGEHARETTPRHPLAPPKGHPEVHRGLAVGVRRPRQPDKPSVGPAELPELEVLDEVRQDGGTRLAVEEDDLLQEPAPAEDELVDLSPPRRSGPLAEVRVEGDVDVLGGGTLSYPRRGPRRRLLRRSRGLAPCPDVGLRRRRPVRGSASRFTRVRADGNDPPRTARPPRRRGLRIAPRYVRRLSASPAATPARSSSTCVRSCTGTLRPAGWKEAYGGTCAMCEV